MKQHKKNLVFSLITIFLFFALAEGIARLFTQTGSYDYVERKIIEQGLRQKKQPGEFRILLYGESTMHGSHLYKKSTIRDWIQLYLRNLLGEELANRVTVVNFGRVGYDSRFISQSFIDTVGYKPDVAVFYSVHNDFVFLENRQEILAKETFGKKIDSLFRDLVKKSAFMTVLRRINISSKIKKQKEDEARAALRSMSEWYDETNRKTRPPKSNLLYPGSQEFETLERKWQGNIGRIVNVARENHIPVVFLNGISRFKDFPPYESIHAESLSSDNLVVWQALVDQAQIKFRDGNAADAAILYQKAIEIDPSYALDYFRLAECFEALGDYEKAKLYYSLANDQDYFPTRAPSVVNKFYDRLAQENLSGVTVLNIKKIFEENSPHGMIDKRLVVDQMHPTIEGQALIALQIVKFIYEKNMFVPKENWHWDRLKTTEELKTSLGIDKDFEYENNMYLANFVGSYLDQAVDYLKKALAIKPHSIKAKSQLAWTYWQLGNKEEASRLYQELNQEAPQEAKKFFGRHPEIAQGKLN